MEYLVIGFAILVGIGRFLRWIYRQMKGTAARPAPQSFSPQAPYAPYTAYSDNPLPSYPPPRRSGAPLTTPSDTRKQQELRAEQERLSRSVRRPSGSPPTPSTPAVPVLFEDTDDWLRAIILQEALGPPLCRRPRP